MLLILTSEQDLAADFLIVYLLERRLPYFRLNVEELHRKYCTIRISNQNEAREILKADGPGLHLDQVNSVWYRRAVHPLPPPDLPPAQRNFVGGELRHFWLGLVLAADVLWVNPIDRVSVAEHKLLQLKIARELGFRIPSSIVSRQPEELKDFAEAFGSAICKPIFHGLLVDKYARSSVYTRRVTADSFDDARSIDLCPVFLQEEIPRQADLRVTIIGGDCFVARIKSENARMIDWRRPDSNVTYSISTIPMDIEVLCKRMMSRLGLHYGAFDFIETPDGQLVFLEINPTGEWAWLEDRLGFPMRESFVRLLYGDQV